MQEHTTKKHRHKGGGKNFLILPLVFCGLIYGLAALIFYPALSPFFSSVEMMFSDGDKDFSTAYENIFVPLPEDTSLESGENGSDQQIDASDVQYPNYGVCFGQLTIEDCGVDAKLFYGDGNVPLRNGVGIYNGSFIPGYGKTVLVAGHNNTFFNGLKYAQPGQEVKISTSYGNYVYEITSAEVKKASDNTAFDLGAQEENLVMYTCYPFDELGLTEQRYFVYAKYVSGPKIIG